MLYGKCFKSHHMQALLGLGKALFLGHFCLNHRFYTVHEKELQTKTGQWIFFNSSYVLNDILHVLISIGIIFPLEH